MTWRPPSKFSFLPLQKTTIFSMKLSNVLFSLCLVKQCIPLPSMEGENLRFSTLGAVMSAEEANRKCRSQGIGWHLPDSQSFIKEFIQELKRKNNVPAVWLDLHKTTFETWRWVDGSTYNEHWDEIRNHDCGGLAIQGMQMRAMRCSERGNGFVCQIRECHETHLTQTCLKYEENWYLVGCSSANWYDARAFCLKRGGDLAMVTKREAQLAILNYIIEKKLYDTCNWIFIGLRKTDWFTTLQGNLTSVYWDIDQPKIGDCVVGKISPYRGTLVWESRPCKEKYSTICQNYNSTLATPRIIPSSSENDIHTALAVGLLFATFLTFSISLFSVIVYFCLTRTEPATGSFHRDIEEMQGVRTIVIVSQAIQPWVHAHIATPLKNIYWHREVRKTNSASGSHMARYALSAYRQIRPSGKLRIICIDAVQADGALFDKTAEEILEHLIKSIKNNKNLVIDAICLPRFSNDSVDPKRLLHLVWELRKSTVVISAAFKYPCLPSTEVLSVGIFKEMETKSSSTSDLQVKLHEHCQMYGARSLGAAIFAGLTAALREDLDTMKEVNVPWTKNFRKAYLKILNKKDVPDWSVIDMSHVKPESESEKEEGENLCEAVQDMKKQCPSMIKELSSSSKSTETTKALGSVFRYENLKDQNCKINIALVRRREKFYLSKEWNIFKFEGRGVFYDREEPGKNKSGDNEATRYMKFFFGILEKSGLDKALLADIVTICDVPIFSNRFDIKVADYLDMLSVIECDVMLTHCLKNKFIKDSMNDLVKNMDILKKQTVVICSAYAERPPVPPNFPGDMVICVGCERHDNEEERVDQDEKTHLSPSKSLAKSLPKYQSCGSTLDFICSKEAGTSKHQAMDPVAAATNAVVIAALVLIKAHALGLEGKILKRLRETSVMHDILRNMCSHPEDNMCSHPGEHEMYDGWGYLDPWDTLNDPEKLETLIRRSVPDKNMFYPWNGKNI